MQRDVDEFAKMRQRLPAWLIFQKIGKKTIALLSSHGKRTGWDQPVRGARFYRASAMTRAVILYYLKQMKSLDELEGYLKFNRQAARACGFRKYTPSRSTISRFMRAVGSHFFENLFDFLLEILFEKGLVTGRHLAIDSTHVKAWSQRKGKKKPQYLLGRYCSFARSGKTPNGFQLGYRVHVATLTRSMIPVAVKVFPGNVHDRKAFQVVFRRALRHVKKPIIISADKGYSSQRNRDLIARIGAMSVIHRQKNENHQSPNPGIAYGNIRFWKLYQKRVAVEQTFAYSKQHFRLYQPRVVERDPVRQHVFIAFCCFLLVLIASQGLKNYSFSQFSI